MTVDGLDELKRSLSLREVELFLPKYKIESSFDLKESLKSIGMVDAFDSNADLSGTDGTKLLYIFAVLHKATITVDEKGCEAAAATAIYMDLETAFLGEKPKPIVFRADHPFLFLIQENSTGSV